MREREKTVSFEIGRGLANQASTGDDEEEKGTHDRLTKRIEQLVLGRALERSFLSRRYPMEERRRLQREEQGRRW